MALKKKSLSQKCRKETSKSYGRERGASKESIAALQTEKWAESGDTSREHQHVAFLHSFKITFPKVKLLLSMALKHYQHNFGTLLFAFQNMFPPVSPSSLYWMTLARSHQLLSY